MSDYGTLTDYTTGESIRPATRDEWLRSVVAGSNGVFFVDRDLGPVDESADPAIFGLLRTVYVAGGGEPVTLRTLARELADKYGDDRDDALRAITSYANDLNVTTGVQSGGQAPRATVNPEEADHIVRAYEAGRDL